MHRGNKNGEGREQATILYDAAPPMRPSFSAGPSGDGGRRGCFPSDVAGESSWLERVRVTSSEVGTSGGASFGMGIESWVGWVAWEGGGDFRTF